MLRQCAGRRAAHDPAPLPLPALAGRAGGTGGQRFGLVAARGNGSAGDAARGRAAHPSARCPARGGRGMTGPDGEARLERLRLLSMAVALCFLFLVVTALVTILRDPYQMDFISYWAAGKLGLHGQAPLAYDVVAHHRVELEATAVGQIPFGYPPAFLLLASP